MQSRAAFRWLSPLGLSVILLLGFGLLNALVGVVIPFLTRQIGNGGVPQPYLDTSSLVWLGFGLFQLGLVWFGVRAGMRWAFWTVIAADVAQLTGWIIAGVQSSENWLAPHFLYEAIFLLPAVVLGWIGLR